MGTRGYRIVKFRGRYWIFFNHWDSYLERMGTSLVQSIPTDPEEYRTWLESQRDFFAKWDDRLQTFLCIQPEHLAIMQSDNATVDGWLTAFDERLQCGTPPYSTGFNDLWIEFTYTFDLDLEVFSIDSSAHYRLSRIPRNGDWIQTLSIINDKRIVFPQLVPEESVASLVLDIEDFDTSASNYWKTLETTKVVSKVQSLSIVSRLRWKLFNIFQASLVNDLSVTLLGWTAKDLSFREIVFFIICLAAGGDRLALVDERRIIKPSVSQSYAAIIAGNKPDGERELISPVGVGYHLQGLPIVSAPSDSKYWFEGALICLIPRLNRVGIFGKAIADAVQYGRVQCARTSFNALLISIEDLVLVRSFPDGSVQHTALLPLISIKSHLSMDARQRYGDRVLGELYDAEVMNA